MITVCIISIDWRYCEGFVYPCGPRNVCKCYYNTASGVTQDCEGRGGVTLSEICSEIASKGYATGVLKAGRNNFGDLTHLNFKGCENLTELDLHYNQISNAEQHIFDDFHQLKTLDLSRNLLPVYEYGWDSSFLPKSLISLKLIGCTNELFNNASFPSFDGQPNLTKLTMDGYPNLQFNNSKITYFSTSGLYLYAFCNITVNR